MKGLLKFITCGSVDDGKSTLIGHILYDAKLLYADQEKTLELDSKVGSPQRCDRLFSAFGWFDGRGGNRVSPLTWHTAISPPTTAAFIVARYTGSRRVYP